MALNTHPAYITMRQKKAIGRPVGFMTSAASLELHRLVLEDPWSSLLRMALETNIHIELVPTPQTGPRSGPVRSVAVRTTHSALQNLVPRREIELGLDFQVAGKAKVTLFAL